MTLHLLFPFPLLKLQLHLMKLGDLRDFLILIACDHLTVLHEDDVVGQRCEFQSMGSHDNSLSFEVIEDGIFHETGPNMDVHCAQHIIIEIYIALGVK